MLCSGSGMDRAPEWAASACAAATLGGGIWALGWKRCWQMAANNCQISRDVIWRRTKKAGALLAVALCNSIFWVEALSFYLHYWPGASTQGYKNLKRLSLNFEADQCKMEWGKIVYCWGKYSTVNNKEENAAEGSNWISIMPMIKDNVRGKGDYRRVSVLGWMAKKRGDCGCWVLIGLGLISKL